MIGKQSETQISYFLAERMNQTGGYRIWLDMNILEPAFLSKFSHHGLQLTGNQTCFFEGKYCQKENLWASFVFCASIRFHASEEIRNLKSTMKDRSTTCAELVEVSFTCTKPGRSIGHLY